MEKKKNKLLLLLLAVAISFGLWLYVITVVSPGSQDTFRNITVELPAEALLEDRGLMLVMEEKPTVTLTLTGNRSDLIKLTSSNITVTADLSRIYEAGDHELQYSISYPGDIASGAITVKSREPSYVKLKVEERVTKTFDLQINDGQTEPVDGFKVQKVEYDRKTVTVTGAASVVNRIEQACVDVNYSGLKDTIDLPLPIVLLDQAGKEVQSKWISSDYQEVNFQAVIQRVLEVPLEVPVKDGGGATAATSQITKSVESILVSGKEADVNAFAETLVDGKLVFGQIDLATVTEDTEFVYNILELLTEGVGLWVENEDEKQPEELKVTVAFPELQTLDFLVQEIEFVNIPEKMKAEVPKNASDLVVKVRGPKDLVAQLKREDLKAVVDLTEAKVGEGMYTAVIEVINEEFAAVGALGGPYTVTVTVEETK